MGDGLKRFSCSEFFAPTISSIGSLKATFPQNSITSTQLEGVYHSQHVQDQGGNDINDDNDDDNDNDDYDNVDGGGGGGGDKDTLL